MGTPFSPSIMVGPQQSRITMLNDRQLKYLLSPATSTSPLPLQGTTPTGTILDRLQSTPGPLTQATRILEEQYRTT